MKTLLAIREREYEWVQQAFPSIHPLLLPICNKPFTEFLIDFAILAGSTEIRLLSDGPLGKVEDYCEDGSRWGIKLSYGHLQAEDSLPELLNKSRKFCTDDRIMIISGFSFIHYDKQLGYANFMSLMPAGTCASCPGGNITLAGPPETSAQELPALPLTLMPLNQIESYFRISMETLETGAARYVLPGYGNEPGCAIGRNVVISKSSEIIKPVSIGNNVQILSGAVIGPGAIIGNNVIVDKESTVKSGIILDNTYIGEHLEINGRIATGNTLIDPARGASIAMEDPHLLSGIRSADKRGSAIRKTVHLLAAAILVALQLIPFLLLFPLLKLLGRWKSGMAICHGAGHGKSFTLPTTLITGNGPLASLASSLSLDRLPLLLRIFTGQLAIIGSTPVPVTLETVVLPGEHQGYRPAVFSYAEAEEWPVNDSDAAIVERYFIVHSTPLKDISMTLKALLNRL
ncbi:MAG: NDP-sugar synthase [Chlorobiaceae bacterium]|nr:NDP-sugar synthase [Chlorobiaceae bacterium]